jgi:hypothetical protein
MVENAENRDESENKAGGWRIVPLRAVGEGLL